MKKILLSMAMMACFATCYAQKALVLFYSQTGTTKTIAEELQKQLDILRDLVEKNELDCQNKEKLIQQLQQKYTATFC